MIGTFLVILGWTTTPSKTTKNHRPSVSVHLALREASRNAHSRALPSKAYVRICAVYLLRILRRRASIIGEVYRRRFEIRREARRRARAGDLLTMRGLRGAALVWMAF